MIPLTPPARGASSFNCPHCGVFAHQHWAKVLLEPQTYAAFSHETREFFTSNCTYCHEFTMWHGNTIIYPDVTTADLPNVDLTDEIKEDYNEARSIVNKSPRGAAALLRLCIQKLCKELGEPGKDLNTDIGNLVRKGMPATIQKALDTVRVIGNECVHPGQMDMSDNRETANKLFGLVNIIADTMITQPKVIEGLYGTLPASKLQAIADRDNGT